MGSSEFVRRSEGREARLPPNAVRPLTPVRKHTSPALAAAAFMMFNDVLVVLGAFVMAVLLQVFVFSRIPQLQALPLDAAPQLSNLWYLFGFLLGAFVCSPPVRLVQRGSRAEQRA